MENPVDDQQLLIEIIAATHGRPTLATVYDAAMALSGGEPAGGDDMDAVVVDGVIEAGFAGTDTGLSDTGLGDTGFTDTGVPTFDAVRERIDARSGTADGQRVLDGSSQEELFEARAATARTKLDEIRRSMRE